MTAIAQLSRRAVLAVGGQDRHAFLQGLVSNDVTKVGPGRAVWAALLTPQGKWLAEFFLLDGGDRLLLDVEAGQRAMIGTLLRRFRLRAKVELADEDLSVYAAWGGAPPEGVAGAPDPRVPEAGFRVLGRGIATTADEAEYDRHRLALGLPDGSQDLESERSTLVEAGFDELGGIDWEKGCYLGQELTARTKYRGLVKRRLTRVRVAGPMPAPGTPVLQGADEVGAIRSGRDGWALALLRLEAIRAERLTCGEAVLTPDPAPWMRWEPIRLATA